MKKRNLIFALSACALIGASSVLLTSCGNNVDVLSVRQKMGDTINSITTSDKFDEKHIVVDAESYLYTAPEYNIVMQGLININLLNDDLDLETTNLNRLGLLYDISFGYSFNVIKHNYDVMKNSTVKENLSSEQKQLVTDLDKSLDDFNQKLNKHKHDVANTTEYLSSISSFTNQLAQNAIYNYQKDYQSFVRSCINLAKKSCEVATEVYNTNYKESDYSYLTTEQLLNFNGKIVSKENKIKVKQINGLNYKVNYTDSEGLLYEATAEREDLILEQNEIIEIDKEYTLAKDVEFELLGKKVNKDSKVKITNINDQSYVVEYVENNRVFSTELVKTNIEDTEAVAGDINLSAEVTLKSDRIFDFDSQIFKSNSSVILSNVNLLSYEIQYIDENNLIYEARNEIKETEVQKGDKVTLKSDTRLDFKGKLVKEGNYKITSLNTNDYGVKFTDGFGNIWTKNITGKLPNFDPMLFDKLSLDGLNAYYTLLVEKLDSKYITSLEKENQFANVFDEYYNDYKEFIKIIFSKRENISKASLSDEISDLEEKHSIYLKEENLQLNKLEKFNMYDFRFNKDFDLEKLSDEEANNYIWIMDFYSYTLNNWNYYYFEVI